MREKKPLEKTVEKYIEFLKMLKLYSNFDENREGAITLKEFIAQGKINKNIYSTLLNLHIIDLERPTKWNYLSFEPDRKLALTVLDNLLVKNKKSRHTPIAGMEAFVTAVERNTEAINRNAIEINKLLKTRENRLGDNTGDLFRVDSERLLLFSAIATAIYGKPNNSLSPFSALNNAILEATDNALAKLKAK